MSKKLFTEYSHDQLKKDLLQMESSGKHETFLAIEESRTIGFATVSIRHDYVEGSTSSPVAYLESIFVEQAFRKQNIAKQLYNRVEKWAKEKECKEIGSDTWLWNESAQAFHSKLGFKKEDVLVHYIKSL